MLDQHAEMQRDLRTRRKRDDDDYREPSDDEEDAGETSDEVFETAPSTPTGAREVDDLSAMLGGMGVR